MSSEHGARPRPRPAGAGAGGTADGTKAGTAVSSTESTKTPVKTPQHESAEHVRSAAPPAAAASQQAQSPSDSKTNTDRPRRPAGTNVEPRTDTQPDEQPTTVSLSACSTGSLGCVQLLSAAGSKTALFHLTAKRHPSTNIDFRQQGP